MIEFKPDDKITETIKIIINKTPKDVKWCLWAGLATFFYGSNRKTTDIDIMIRKSDMQKFINSLNEFVVSYPKDTEKDIFRFVSTKLKMNNFEIEVASDVTIETEGKKYLFEFDEGMISKIRKIKINDVEIPTMSPEDVIVFKAICQRGIEKGKHDIEDIEGVLKNQKIDWKYLEERSRITKSYDRVFGLLKRLGYKMTRIFLATKVPKGEDAKKITDVSEDIIAEIKSMKNVEIIKGENRDLDESDFLLVFGHDCKHIKNSDIVIVDAREKIGAGTAQEMLIAKYFKKPVITVLPKDTHHRRTNFEINEKIVEDWIHPFIHSTSDVIIENYKDLSEWIRKCMEGKMKVKDISIIDKSVEYYEKQI